MSAKTLKRVAIALVVVLFLWGLVEIFGGRSDRLEEVSAVHAVSEANADSVEFERQNDTVRLVKVNGRWSVNGFTASGDAVTELFHALEQDVPAELVARSASSHARMGVDSTGGRLRIVAGGKPVTTLIVGKQGAAYGTRYVRPVGDDRVYQLEGDLVHLYDRGVDDWRDKDIAKLDPDSIAAIAVQRGTGSYVVTRHDSTWTLPGGAPADSGAVHRMLEEYRDVEAQGSTPFATPAQADSADFQHPDRHLTVWGAQGDTLLALAFDSTNGGFWVRHDSGGTVYKLLTWKVNGLMPADTALKRK